MKPPASVEIVAANAAKTSPHPIGNPDPIGNVPVTYADGTRDLWTTKGNCSLAHVGSDGTVGWTANGSAVKINSADWMRPNGTLVLCRLGKVIAQIKSGKGFIEQWQFIRTEDGWSCSLAAPTDQRTSNCTTWTPENSSKVSRPPTRTFPRGLSPTRTSSSGVDGLVQCRE
jgi:hypothetical protein